MIIFKNYGLKDWLEIGEKRLVGDWKKKDWLEKIEERRLVGKD